MKRTTTEIIGWYGAATIVIAYFLVSFSFVSSENVIYQLLNGAGAISVVLVSVRHKTYQSAVLNSIWFVIALIAIIRIVVR